MHMFYKFVQELVQRSRRIDGENLRFTGNVTKLNSGFPGEYKGLTVRTGFGQGNWAKATWIGFLADGQTIQKGIYPVYLYYREQDILVLAYGISATNKPTMSWPNANNLVTIKRYLNENYGVTIDRYPFSFVFKTYSGAQLNSIDESFDTDLDKLIDYYKEVMTGGTAAIAEQNDEQKESIPLQCIYFGTPGSGKSYYVKTIVDPFKDVFRTTFHPDSDYATFVGAYKPKKIGEKLTYEFIPQAFTDAYVAAWKDTLKPVFLVIEEINRGNCAQIFGDLFQLLDRKENGESEYSINADADLRSYLEQPNVLGVDAEGIKKGKLSLPPNFHILATMNTSDQSLFPMDSAFKRRWSWKYVPIVTDDSVESKAFEIIIDNTRYSWHEFLKAVNKKIVRVTESEDKQMGNFFIKGTILKEEFKSKVMFYLWSEVCKDEYKHNSFFKYEDKDGEKEFSFNDLYPDGGNILNQFIPQVIESEKE